MCCVCDGLSDDTIVEERSVGGWCEEGVDAETEEDEEEEEEDDDDDENGC